MKLKDADWIIPLLEAAKNGETIQKKLYTDEWCDIKNCEDFNYCKEDYRIKPEPVYRPWTYNEVPVGAWLKAKNTINSDVSLITGRSDTWISGGGGWRLSHSDALLFQLYSIDRGKTWLPCGVVVA